MSCSIDRSGTIALVTAYLHNRFGGSFTEDTNLEGFDEQTRRTFSFGIKSRLKSSHPDCDRTGFGPDDTQDAKTVKDLVDVVFNAL